ncbi:MAG: hypothetical protein R2827_02685 [Bdellovibrionales bacterium]
MSEESTENSVLLKSGKQISADVVVTATGFNLSFLESLEVFVDGNRINIAEAFTYKGLMLSNVPNLIVTFGYINATWTLRVELIAKWICKLLKYMKDNKKTVCNPRMPKVEKGMSRRPFVENFSPGYINRDLHKLPKQGDKWPWLSIQNYQKEQTLLLKAPVNDGVLVFY